MVTERQYGMALPSDAPVPNGSSTCAPAMIVVKFSGSSLAGVQHLQRVCDIIRERIPRRPIVVLSAMGTTTNELLQVAQIALESGVVDISKIRKRHEEVLVDLGPAGSAVIAD